LVAHLNLGGSLTDERHPALDLSGANPSNSLRTVWTNVQFDTSELVSKIMICLLEGEVEERHEVSPIYSLLHLGTLPPVYCSDLMDKHESMR
jgi:hypothetical protein